MMITIRNVNMVYDNIFPPRTLGSREESNLPRIPQVGFPLTQFSYLYNGVIYHLNPLLEKQLWIK